MIACSIRVLSLLVLLALQACASPMSSDSSTPAGPSGQAPVKPGYAPIPGGYWMYSFGTGQTRQNFENVEIAQSYYGLWSRERWWGGAIEPTIRAAANIIGLQAYYPLHVRWKLKDGREFILENIDVAAIMRDYFKTHSLQLQWQREHRSEAKFGDAEPLLAHELKDDTVILKWVITLNLTPVNERLTATGAATQWDFQDEDHIVIVLKGNPTRDIDFGKHYERLK